ncbi:MAG: hypothetical protein ACTJLM_01555 [Ehrlichia sp.]
MIEDNMVCANYSIKEGLLNMKQDILIAIVGIVVLFVSLLCCGALYFYLNLKRRSRNHAIALRGRQSLLGKAQTVSREDEVGEAARKVMATEGDVTGLRLSLDGEAYVKGETRPLGNSSNCTNPFNDVHDDEHSESLYKSAVDDSSLQPDKPLASNSSSHSGALISGHVVAKDQNAETVNCTTRNGFSSISSSDSRRSVDTSSGKKENTISRPDVYVRGKTAKSEAHVGNSSVGFSVSLSDLASKSVHNDYVTQKSVGKKSVGNGRSNNPVTSEKIRASEVKCDAEVGEMCTSGNTSATSSNALSHVGICDTTSVFDSKKANVY